MRKAKAKAKRETMSNQTNPFAMSKEERQSAKEIATVLFGDTAAKTLEQGYNLALGVLKKADVQSTTESTAITTRSTRTERTVTRHELTATAKKALKDSPFIDSYIAFVDCAAIARKRQRLEKTVKNALATAMEAKGKAA